MTDGFTSDQMRDRALRSIDPRGRPSTPGPPNELDIATEEAVMREEVEGYERKSPGAGNLEAAGIEPASHPSPNGSSSRGFEHWKLDGELPEGESSREERTETVARSPSGSFSAKTTICGIDFEVRRDGKHTNLHVFDNEEDFWKFEPLETAIPKMAALLGAARLVANSS